MPKQVELIIPRGPFLNLKCSVGLWSGITGNYSPQVDHWHVYSQQLGATVNLHIFNKINIHRLFKMHTQSEWLPHKILQVHITFAHRCMSGGSRRADTRLGQAAESRFL
ncbi:hypothetical protein ILYODFUR_013620 [Ilyodon furcidens]|uniref:Uncharacterized protein n=1 Tax=Ilyodon furcidens TaxID=33524 RepID=A0ABV0SX43_9TELE